MKKRVLVVELDLELRGKIASYVVDSLRMEVVLTSCGSEALELLCNEKFDVMIQDICINEIDGLTLLKKARSLIPGMPVIVTSKEGSVRNTQQIENAGGILVIEPYPMKVLGLLLERQGV